MSWLKVVIGAALLLVAALQFRNRPRNGDRVELPKWIGRVDEIKPLPAAGLGVVMAGLNPKNLLLAVAAAAAIAQTGISGGEQAIAYLVFALVGTLGVGTPVGIYFAMGARSEKPLTGAEGLDGSAQRRDLGGHLPDHRREAHRRCHHRADCLTSYPERTRLTPVGHR